jgi:hypothetical protein
MGSQAESLEHMQEDCIQNKTVLKLLLPTAPSQLASASKWAVKQKALSICKKIAFPGRSKNEVVHGIKDNEASHN